jgi:hypothetical protein
MDGGEMDRLICNTKDSTATAHLFPPLTIIGAETLDGFMVLFSDYCYSLPRSAFWRFYFNSL